MKTNVLTVVTPEGVTFPLNLAGPIVRCTAWVVDLCCIIVIINVISYLSRILQLVAPDFASAFYIFAYFIISVFYGIVLEWIWKGQTIGKKLLKLRVMDFEGFQLNFNQIVLRNLFRAIDVLPFFYFIGGLSCFFSKNYQRLGDFVAQTVVVREIKIQQPDLSNIISGKFNSLKEFPHIIARLRKNILPEEAALLLNALLRRNTLSPDARTKIYQELSIFVKTKVSFPEKAVDNLSDEKYLRNIVDVLYNVG